MTAPPIDADHLDDLIAVLGQMAVDRLIDALIADLAVTPARIAALVAAGDVAAARGVAHGLRGAAAGLGCVGVATLAGRIESAPIEQAPADELVDVAALTASILAARWREKGIERRCA